MHIATADNTIVASYTYDAWGNIESLTGTLADTVGTINPIRYRGYYYDNETELYYLNARYYDSEIGRFINADSLIAGIGGSTHGYNIFAYCFNNPVNMMDYAGEWPTLRDVFNVAAAVTVVAVAVVAVVSSGGAAAAPIIAAASTLAGTAVSATAVTTAATGIAVLGVTTMGMAATAQLIEASSNSGSNSHQSNRFSGKSKHDKNGNRIDFEYNGNGTGNVHVHLDGKKGKKIIWSLKNGEETAHTVSKSVSKIIKTPELQKAISQAIDNVLSLAGLK